MSTKTIPEDVIPTNLDFYIQYNSQSFTSQLNGAVQTSSLPGDKWVCNYTYSNLMGVKARKMRAFLASLKGVSGRFYGIPYDHKNPSGNPEGNPLVKGANQTGESLTIDGCSPNITGWLLAGDYFQVGNELKIITEDCNTNANGETLLVFEPPLRTSPTDNAQIITRTPKCIMMCSDDTQARWSAQIGSADSKLYAFTLSGIEAIDI